MEATAGGAALAFGVDPTRRERYSLRQARYEAIGVEIARLLPEFARRNEPLRLLDVGVWNGVSMRYIEARDPDQRVEYHGVDLHLHPGIYKPSAWKSLQQGDLLAGLPQVPSEAFDVVLCEQVLEHLPEVEAALTALSRVLKPGGWLIVGVPIFPPGIAWIRRHGVPLWDRMVGRAKPRGHLQVFSKRSFLTAIERHCGVTVLDTRGFRIISGGWLRPLENSRGWWRFNRWLGRRVPGLCTEIQVVARKIKIPLPSQPSRTEDSPCFACTQALSAA
jgi:SAM-dependent methyltransferase